MIPVLKRYATQYRDFPELRVADAVRANGLAGLALQRWYELDPENARVAIVSEIERPRPRFDARTLGMLPDETLPGVDSSLVQRLAVNPNTDFSANLASLIERYGSKSVVPGMLSIVDENVGRWACAIQAPALAYLLHADPEIARPRIVEAVTARGKGFTACNHALFTEIAKLRTDIVLEEIAIQSLTDDDPPVARDAAEYLRQYGSAAAEQPLWNALELLRSALFQVSGVCNSPGGREGLSAESLPFPFSLKRRKGRLNGGSGNPIRSAGKDAGARRVWFPRASAQKPSWLVLEESDFLLSEFDLFLSKCDAGGFREGEII